jgi:isoleucyl-tRNA synthetase
MRRKALAARGIETLIPFTVDDAGYFTKDAPGFGPDREGGAARVIDDNGKKGDANKAVIEALIAAQHAVRARAAEALLSAFVALEEAGHLPQHAAVVRLHG